MNDSMRPRAPANIRNAFTIDVEDYYQVEGFAHVVDKSTWERYPSRVERNTDAILELLARHDTRGTFFVLGWVAERHPGLVRRIAAAGHEVASHGYSHTMVYKQLPSVFRLETRRSKALLEDIVQRPVTGYRAATYSITPRSLWALDILCEEGFQYDSSIFPIRHDRYGMTDGPRFPYTVRARNGMEITEFPISTVNIARYQLPIGGGGYFRLLPYAVSAAGLARVNREREPFIFYLHPWEIDPEQPHIAGGAMANFRHRVNLRSCMHKLDRLLSDFAFTTAAEVLAGYEYRDLVPFTHTAEDEEETGAAPV